MYLWPHAVEGIHVEWQIIKFTLIACHTTVGVAVELNDRVYKVPHFLVTGVEDVCTILVHIDALDVLTIYIATDMWAFVDHKHLFAGLFSFVRESSSVKTGANYEIIVMGHIYLFFSLLSLFWHIAFLAYLIPDRKSKQRQQVYQ